MTDEIATGDAEPVQNTAGNTNISVTDFAQRRLGEMTPKEEPEAEPEEEVTEEVEETVTEEEEEVQSEETSEATEETESDDVLSQYNLDDMSEEDLKELSEKLGSRAVARFGELTAKRKAAEERLAQLEAKLSEKNPLETRKVENNPYDNLDSIEKLQEKATEVDGIVEWAEDILFESDGYSADDVVTEIDGKEWTKKEVRQALLKARKAQKTFLPDQLSKVQAQVEGEQLAEAFQDRAKKELKWLDGEDNDLRKQFEATVGDERFKKLKQVVKREAPDVAAQLDYWFAHATNSIYGRKPVQDTKQSVKLNPSTTATPSSSKPEKGTSRTAKAIKELESRFKQTGNARDFAALRKLKLQQR
jgi:nicotinamide mononucleotide adenylyltransferase